jgi:phage baseplate assembly protein W
MTTNINTYQNSSAIYEYEDIYTRDRIYSDFDLRLIKHPLNNNLITLKEEMSVQRALVNLILTEPGEKPFHPNFGTPLNGLLFDIDLLNPLDLEDQIEKSIKLFEPRVKVKKIKIIDGRDSNSIGVEIVYSIINLEINRDIKVHLKRLR